MLQPQEKSEGGKLAARVEIRISSETVSLKIGVIRQPKGVKNVLQHVWVYFCDMIIFEPCIEGLFASATREGEGAKLVTVGVKYVITIQRLRVVAHQHEMAQCKNTCERQDGKRTTVLLTCLEVLKTRDIITARQYCVEGSFLPQPHFERVKSKI